MALRRSQVITALAAIAALLSVATTIAARRPMLPVALTLGTLVAVVTAVLLLRHVPSSPVPPALAWSGAAVAIVLTSDALVDSADRGRQLPMADVVRPLSVGIWPVNLVGLFVLLLVFPDGPSPGRRWRHLVVLYAVSTIAIVVLMWNARQVDGRIALEGTAPRMMFVATAMAGISISFAGAIGSVLGRYRDGSARRRAQIRWLALAGACVLVLLVAGWILQLAGTRVELAFSPFLLAILALTPLTIAVAVVREDLFDIGEIDDVVWRVVGSVIDRDRSASLRIVRRFEADVRAGCREPEEVQDVLREAQHDADLTLLLRAGSDGWTRLDGTAAPAADGLTLAAGGTQIARIQLSDSSARARRRATQLAQAAWVSIEVSRLRLGLRSTMDDLRTTHDRLARVAATERRDLERDLHDGVQQRLVATGMRLRTLQLQLNDCDASDEIDVAIAELEGTLAELRRVAQGVRPSRLDDGLAAALDSVRHGCPLPIHLVVEQLPQLPERVALTAYLVVAEAVTNALKHAHASELQVHVSGQHGWLIIRVQDDGVGGLRGDAPSTLRDRVRVAGGGLCLVSAPGAGTTIDVSLPCE